MFRLIFRERSFFVARIENRRHQHLQITRSRSEWDFFRPMLLFYSKRPVVYKSTLVWPLVNSPVAASQQRQMKRSSTTSDPEEIVEDSEPERIRLRDQSRTTIRSTPFTHAGRSWDTDSVVSANCQQQQSFSNGGPKTLATTAVGLYITTT